MIERMGVDRFDNDVATKLLEAINKINALVDNLNHIEQEMWTDELRASISKPVLQFSKDGEFISEYFGAREAARLLDIVPSSIIECCNKKRKSAGGFIWKYKE